MSRGWRLVLPALLAGLLAGVWIGSRCERSAQRRLRHQGPDAEKALKKIRKELVLRDEQTAAVRKIMEARKSQFAAARREGRERVRALRADVDREIEALLDAEQKKKFAEMKIRWDKKMREGRPARAP